MKKQLSQVQEFHKAFNVFTRTNFEPTLPFAVAVLRREIMQEELKEWFQSVFLEQSKQHRAKELADLLYTVYGTILAEGLQDVIENVFDAVHGSNMSKLGIDGKPILRNDGKVLKGENYTEPDLSFLL